MLEKRVVALASQKGGTGKTTTAINLGACLVEMGQKVLLLDTDPQANMTTGLGMRSDHLDKTIYDVMLNPNRSIDIAIYATGMHNLDLVPSTLDLAGAEVELSNKTDKIWVLSQAMQKATRNYDYIFIDTPPSLGLFTQNALLACTEVIVPLQVHFYGLNAIQQLLRTILLLQEDNKTLHISGIVCTMYDRRNSLSKVIEETIREELKELVFETVIPINVALAEAPASGQPISTYAPASTGAQAYHELAKEVMNRG
ncbi:MAG: ParA family protein [bacterium]